MMRRRRAAVIAGLLVTTVLSATGTASAHSGERDEEREWTTTRSVVYTGAEDATPLDGKPVVFGHDACRYIPDGFVVTIPVTAGSRTLKTRVDHNGTVVFRDSVTFDGIASDNAGHHYRFHYEHLFSASTNDGGVTAVGTFKDGFSMRGDGPVRLNNGFLADVSASGWRLVSSFGDPIALPTPTTLIHHCDPL